MASSDLATIFFFDFSAQDLFVFIPQWVFSWMNYFIGVKRTIEIMEANLKAEPNKEKKMYAAENGLQGDPRLQGISKAIRVIPHFPKAGIMFQDITTLLLNHKVFKDTVDIFVDRYKDMGISVVAGIEARGFMFGPSIALAIGAKFVPLRKPGKLPGEVISEAYELEYGKDCLEMHIGSVNQGERAVIIDDLVATGGTLGAAIKLLERMGAQVVECGCVIGLREAKGQNRLNGKPLYILVEPRELEDCQIQY